jgi:hypothetical protein
MAKHERESEATKATPFWFSGSVLKDADFSDSLKRTQAAFEDGMRTLSDEALHFMRERLDHSSEALEKFRDAKDVASVLSVQQKWFADLARDYYEETMRVSEVMRKIIAEGFPNGDAQPNGSTPVSKRDV